jgi:hypothetical protein
MKMKAIKPLKEKGFKKSSLKKKPLRYAVNSSMDGWCFWYDRDANNIQAPPYKMD